MSTDMAANHIRPVATDLIPLKLTMGPDDGHPRIGAHDGRSVPIMSRKQYREMMSGRGGQGDDGKFLREAAKEALTSAALAGAGEIVTSRTMSGLRAISGRLKTRHSLDLTLGDVSKQPIEEMIRGPVPEGTPKVTGFTRVYPGDTSDGLVLLRAQRHLDGALTLRPNNLGGANSLGEGAYFTSKIDQAVKGLVERGGSFTGDAGIGAYKLGLKNPKIVRLSDKSWSPREFRSRAFRDAHDGIVVLDDSNNVLEALVFDPKKNVVPVGRVNFDTLKPGDPSLSVQEDSKGGHVTKGGNAPDLTGMSNFLATDKVPDTLFGIPVVSRREDYTEADLRFFKDHPEAGGYYDMGEEPAEDVGTEGAPVQADKAGVSKAAAYEIERRNAADAVYASRYVEGEDSTVVPTGSMVEELLYDPSGWQPGDIGYEDPKDVIAGLPKTSYERGGKYYQKVPEKIDRLALTTDAERDALAKIQSEFRAVSGRDMDSEVAAIRAKLSAGTIRKDEAKQLARILRRSRDIKAAKDAAFQFWSEIGAPNGKHPVAMAESDWKRFYVDTEKLGVLAAKHGIQSVVDVVNISPEGSLYDIMNRTVAKRFGLEEVLEDRDIMVRNPELDIPANYSGLSRGRKAVAKRIAMRIADGADGIDNAARRTAAKRYLDRIDIRQVDENNYEGLNKGIPFEVKKGTKKVRTGRYRARHADMDGGRTMDDLDSFALHADSKGGDAYADRAIAAMNDVFPFTKAHEGFRENAYKDTQGVWTVGYGQTTIDGRPVKEGDTISEKNASVFAWRRVRENAYSMYKRYPWMEKLSQNALAAAYDLAYNLGDGIFTEKNSPEFNRRLAAGEDPEKVLWSEYGTYLGGKDATPETRKGLKNRRDDVVKKWKV